MKRREFNLALGAAAAAPAVLSAGAIAAGDTWTILADVAESCSCEIPCPCNFGRPTDLTCHGSRLIQIRTGSVGGLDLAGVSFVVTFEMGKWTKIYVDESHTDAQQAAFEAALDTAFAGFKKLMRAQSSGPLTVIRSDDTLRFSVPESTVEIKRMSGLDGKPITIANLPSPFFHGYTQYESVVHAHASADAEWSYAGTNGFTSQMIAKG